LQKTLNAMVEADALVFGCPRYFLIPSKMVAFMERLACLSFFTEMNHPEARHPLEDKPCGLRPIENAKILGKKLVEAVKAKSTLY